MLSLEVVDFGVLFMLSICDESRLLRTNTMEYIEPYIKVNMQISGRTAAKSLGLA